MSKKPRIDQTRARLVDLEDHISDRLLMCELKSIERKYKLRIKSTPLQYAFHEAIKEMIRTVHDVISFYDQWFIDTATATWFADELTKSPDGMNIQQMSDMCDRLKDNCTRLVRSKEIKVLPTKKISTIVNNFPARSMNMVIQGSTIIRK